MANIKLNSSKVNKKEDGFDVIPSSNIKKPINDEPKQSYVKMEAQEEPRKYFANKKANMALIFIAVVFVLVILGSMYYIYKPIK